MKLYTEFEVKFAMYTARCQQDLTFDEVLEQLTPIELPTDEQIGQGRDEHIPIDEKDMWSERFFFTVGAIWMRDKIQGKITPNQ